MTASKRADEIERRLDALQVTSTHQHLYHGASVGHASRLEEESPGQTLGRAVEAMAERKSERRSAREHEAAGRRSDELARMGKTELEFFDADGVDWIPVPERPGVSERILSRDAESGLVTRIVRWDPGLDTSSAGAVTHEHFEEVLILSGSMHDLRLQQTFSAGWYACRPPGMVHGPWTTDDGCVMLEIQYAA